MFSAAVSLMSGVLLAHSITMFVGAALFLALGTAIYRGNTKLIHDYHQRNIKESERTEYGRAFAKGMFAICATLLLSGIIALFGKDDQIATVSLIVLFAGLIISGVVIIKVQKKYNGGLF